MKLIIYGFIYESEAKLLGQEIGVHNMRGEKMACSVFDISRIYHKFFLCGQLMVAEDATFVL